MLDKVLKECRTAKNKLALLSGNERNTCLEKIASALLDCRQTILAANQEDIARAKASGLTDAMIERLTLNEKRLKDLSDSVYSLIELEDVIGKCIETIERPNGLKIEKVRVPFGVICVIFESRPNVCVDIAALCLKTANACVLKGGKEAIFTNKALVECMKNAIKEIVDENCITLISSTDRTTTNELICKREYIDLLIPRGGRGLIQYVVTNAKIPYIETGAGNCHLYVHRKANLDMAIQIAINAKHQRPSVCNSIENIIIDSAIAEEFLPLLYKEFSNLNIEMRGCRKCCRIIPIQEATEEDYDTEYNANIIALKIAYNIDEAISHINLHSSKHSEVIVTEDIDAYERFLNEIDSACVYHNASTRFTDGGEFGFGAEIGISTQKLHARGPMGLKEICSYKYKIYGKGQVRS